MESVYIQQMYTFWSSFAIIIYSQRTRCRHTTARLLFIKSIIAYKVHRLFSFLLSTS